MKTDMRNRKKGIKNAQINVNLTATSEIILVFCFFVFSKLAKHPAGV